MRHTDAMLLAVSALAAPVAPTAQPATDNPYGWMDELAGHCWSATHPDGTRDTQCYTLQYNRFLRGTIEIVAPASGPSRPPYRGDSVFLWDAARSEIAFHYWSNAGNVGAVTGRVEGETLVFPNPGRGSNAPPTRTVWTRIDANSFRVAVQRQTAGDWADEVSLVYTRSSVAP